MKRPPEEKALERIRLPLTEAPVEGETYSLYGQWRTTDEYYRRVREVTDRCQDLWGPPAGLLARLRDGTGHRRIFGGHSKVTRDPFLQGILSLASESLSVFTTATPAHLRALRIRQRMDSTLSTPRDAYHLLMVEIELTNRVNREAFRRAPVKLAFLPHCLRDWTRECRSSVDGLDYVCRGCAKGCWINGVSKLLRTNGITPYLWMSANLPRLFRRLAGDGHSIGIIGVACIPELGRGMRLCSRHRVAVTGVPLNANRCRRWTGSFNPNSVNLDQLAAMVDASRFSGGGPADLPHPGS